MRDDYARELSGGGGLRGRRGARNYTAEQKGNPQLPMQGMYAFGSHVFPAYFFGAMAVVKIKVSYDSTILIIVLS